jgi:type III secretion system YscJ/HrcJ family lipoprotein
MRRALILLPVLLFLVGCRTSLFEGLDEDQANRIVAALSHHGINGYKERNADRTWNISVDDADAVVATELASAYALPRGGHANLGELFSRQGLISSPEEDRVRYVFGLSQELSETLEKMDGVLRAHRATRKGSNGSRERHAAVCVRDDALPQRLQPRTDARPDSRVGGRRCGGADARARVADTAAGDAGTDFSRPLRGRCRYRQCSRRRRSDDLRARRG